MRRALVLGLVLLLAPSATAAAPTVYVGASAPRGLAPFAVTLTATGDAAAYAWDLGDGTRAEGAVVEHVYSAPGRYTAVVTATSASGETAQASVAVTAHRLAFEAPARGTWGREGRFTGSIFPPLGRATVTIMGPRGIAARGRTGADGGFAVRTRLRSRGPFRAQVAGFESAADAVLLRPQLAARLDGTPAVGARLALVAQLRPAAAGTLRIRIAGRTWESTSGVLRIPISTGKVASFRIRAESLAAEGYLGVRRSLEASVAIPQLRAGARGASVLALERRLRELRYALPRVDRFYGRDTTEAVLAFQKVNGLPWTGRVDARVWRALGRATTPKPRLLRFRGDYIEISKGRQYLMTVRNGRVTQIVHVSTGATGNTPLGSSTARSRAGTGCSGIPCTSCAASPSTATRRCPRTPRRTAACGCRCGSPRASTRRIPTGAWFTSTGRAVAVLAVAAGAWLAYDVVWGRSGDRPLAWDDRSAVLGEPRFVRATQRELETRGELQRLLDEETVGRARSAPALDYDERRVFLIVLGPRSSPAYGLEVLGVREENRRVVVTVRELAPGQNDAAPAGVTAPFRLLLLPPGDKPIRVEWKERG